jgi:OsmC subfamily peroxiredoxin
MIRKARAVWRGTGRDGNSDLSSDSSVLAITPCSFRIRFENEKGTHPEELIAAAHAGCFAMALTFRLQGVGNTSTELNTEAVVTIEQDKEGFLVSRSALTLRASVPNLGQDMVAHLTARHLVVDVRTSHSVHSIPGHLAHADPLIQRFECWARGLLAEGFSLDKAAHALATSKRTLARRMQSVLGKSPLAFFQDLRIERAVHLLRTSRASVDQIAAEVGYAEGATLRALLRRRVGRGVREIRRSQRI